MFSGVWAAGHTYGTLAAVSGPGHEAVWVPTVEVEGSTMVFAGMFLGYGYLITVFMLMQAAFLWHLASIQRKGVSVRGVAGVCAVLGLLNAVASWAYLIAIPAAFAVAIATCCGLAATLDRNNSSQR